MAVDFYRVSGVVLIVLGHWLAACVTFTAGRFGRQNPLVDMPWTQWLTWPFQAVPLFFLVAGYASAVSWSRWREVGGLPRHTWLRHRLARTLGPTTVYVASMLAVVGVLLAVGAPAAVLEYAGWAVAMQLWFLSVYLVVVVLTPVAIAAHRRWGLAVPAMLGVLVAAVDAASIGAGVPYLGWLNYLLCWGALYQLGIAWCAGLLSVRRALLMGTCSALVLALLIKLAAYPVSMIGVPGEAIENSSPPSLAMLAFALSQAAVAVALAPALNRILRPDRVRRALSVANDNVITLYLWHMIPVVIVAIIGYPSGLLPQPAEGSAAWLLARLEWVAILSVVAAAQMALLWWRRDFFAGPLPTFGVRLGRRWAELAMVAGAVMTAYALGFFAARGFAPDGRFPFVVACVFAVGAVLVALRPRDA